MTPDAAASSYGALPEPVELVEALAQVHGVLNLDPTADTPPPEGSHS